MPAMVRRLLSALMLAVFSLRVFAPEQGHACGAMAGQATTVGDDTGAHGGHGHAVAEGLEAGHGGGAHQHHVGPPDGTPERGSEPTGPTPPCDCSAWCCCLPSLLTPPQPVAVGVVATLGDRAVPSPWPATETVALRADRLLPFATAPPRA
jgi:hypothetical protein